MMTPRNSPWKASGVRGQKAGYPRYPKFERLLIIADCGGSNGYQVRLWRLERKNLADELNLTIQVGHVPLGTSKWTKIEHRMFCHITNNLAEPSSGQSRSCGQSHR
ncbi:MAG: ISAzo13-like element transposase-related protein [Gammaproteobacteria bacterium]